MMLRLVAVAELTLPFETDTVAYTVCFSEFISNEDSPLSV